MITEFLWVSLWGEDEEEVKVLPQQWPNKIKFTEWWGVAAAVTVVSKSDLTDDWNKKWADLKTQRQCFFNLYILLPVA